MRTRTPNSKLHDGLLGTAGRRRKLRDALTSISENRTVRFAVEYICQMNPSLRERSPFGRTAAASISSSSTLSTSTLFKSLIRSLARVKRQISLSLELSFSSESAVCSVEWVRTVNRLVRRGGTIPCTTEYSHSILLPFCFCSNWLYYPTGTCTKTLKKIAQVCTLDQSLAKSIPGRTVLKSSVSLQCGTL